MLLQERNYELYYDREIEDEVNSHQCIEQRAISSSVGLSDTFPCEKISSPNSNSRLRRSTFDLSSVNSLATSSSDSSSYCIPSPSRKTSTLRYRGQSSSPSSYGNPSFTEGAATEALLHLAEHNDTKSTLREVRREPSELKHSLDETRGHCKRRREPATICTEDSASSSTSITDGDDSMSSISQYCLEVIILGYLVVPFLQLTITIERFLRGLFVHLQRYLGLAFDSLFGHSSSSEDLNFDWQELYSSTANPLQRESSDHNRDVSGSCEAVCCYSSSSSCEDEGEHDGWGHFADFQDELADEASFIPSCSANPLRGRAASASAVPPTCVTALETLAEGREEDDDAGEDWSF